MGTSDVMFTPRSRQVSTIVYAIGAVLFVYGAGLALVTSLLALVALQGADEQTAGLPHLALLLVALAVPAVLVLIGWGLMRGRSAAYRAAVLLPIVIVPLATWSLLYTAGWPATPLAMAAELLGMAAVFASGSILLSIALLVAGWRSKGHEA